MGLKSNSLLKVSLIPPFFHAALLSNSFYDGGETSVCIICGSIKVLCRMIVTHYMNKSIFGPKKKQMYFF